MNINNYKHKTSKKNSLKIYFKYRTKRFTPRGYGGSC